MRAPSSQVARGVAIAIVAIIGAAIAYILVAREEPRSTGVTPPAETAPVPSTAPIPSEAVSLGELREVAGAQSLPMHWAGARPDVTYELTREADGSTYVRYLTDGAKIGDPAAAYLVVATYPREDGFADVTGATMEEGNTSFELPDGGLAVQEATRPSSVYLSYPGAAYQVEVYSPEAGMAASLVKAGRIVPVAGTRATGGARSETLAGLRRLGRETVIYWAGPRPRTTYEVTQVPMGATFVRYLPPGARVGDPRASFLVVATYPDADALERLRDAGERSGAATIELENGGLAVYDRARPTSVFLGFPDVAHQIEVFSPKPGEARGVVERGLIAPVR